MKKILILGCEGMAGHVVKKYMESLGHYDVWGLARRVSSKKNIINLDVSKTNELEELLSLGGYDVVINCVGLLNKTAEDNPELAIWFNAYLPHLLASFGNKYKFKLIHISTDCVFSGEKGSYKEDSLKDGIGFYAQSKALGEIVNSKDLTFRTSIIGPDLNPNGIGLFNWFMSQESKINGYSQAYWSGVTTIELAKGINESINNDLVGLYHFVNNSKICKYDLVKEFNLVFKQGEIDINPLSDYIVDKSLICTRSDFNYSVPSYKVMIKEMKEWMFEYKSLYKHYDF